MRAASPRPPAARGAATALAGLLTGLLAACAGAARVPAPAPAPGAERAPAGRDSAAAPAVPVPAVVRGPSVAARYSSGTRRYAVVTSAVVDLATDGALETDSLVTRAHVTYVLGGGGAGQSVGGAVDSVFVTSRRSPATSQAVTVAVPFSGTLGASGVRLAGDTAAAPAVAPAGLPPTAGQPPAVAAPAPCLRAGGDALLAVARELLVALPPTLAEGAAWRDSSATTSCRGNVPLTTSTVHEYRVTRLEADSAGARTATVERTSRSTVVGQGAGGSVGTVVTGTGSGQGRLTFDLATGRYLGGDLTSAADLSVSAGGRTQRLTQRGTTRVTLVP